MLTGTIKNYNTQPESLKATVNLRVSHVGSILVPSRTLVAELSFVRHGNLVLCFKELDSKALADVPRLKHC